MAVRAESLGKRLGGRDVLVDVSFGFEHGIMAITGANGSGKSTLLALLAGYIRPSAGAFSLDVEPSRVGYLPQSYIRPAGVTVRDFVTLAAWAQRAPRFEERASRELERIGIAEHGNTKLRNASGGTARLAAVAAVLLARADVLLLDEPFAGVAEHLRQALSERLREHSRTRAVVVVTHDMNFIDRYADRMLILNSGRIILDEAVAVVKEQAGSSSVARTVRSRTLS